MLQTNLDLVVQNTQCDQRFLQSVCPWNDNWFHPGEQVEALQCAGDRISENLAGEMSHVDAVPGVALAVKDIG